MKPYLILKTVLLFVALGLADRLPAQDKKTSELEKSSIWMKAKLEASRSIVGALTESDFEKIRSNAEAMAFLGYLEKWARAEAPDYNRQVSYFDFANRELIRQAREQNLEGATLAYNQLVVSCVQCHRIVRDAKTKK